MVDICGQLGRNIEMQSSKDSSPEFCQLVLRDQLTPGPIFRGDLSVTTTSMAPNVSTSTPLRFAKSISCGSFHSLVVLVDGTLLSCGLNNYGQLGLGSQDTTPRTSFMEVTYFSKLSKKVCQAAGGCQHSVVLLEDGTVWAFGRGDYGQWGLGTRCPEKGTKIQSGALYGLPRQVALAESVKIKEICCGDNHNLALSSEGQVYSWGFGETLALGHGEDQDEFLPRLIVKNSEQNNDDMKENKQQKKDQIPTKSDNNYSNTNTNSNSTSNDSNKKDHHNKVEEKTNDPSWKYVGISAGGQHSAILGNQLR